MKKVFPHNISTGEHRKQFTDGEGKKGYWATGGKRQPETGRRGRPGRKGGGKKDRLLE